MLRFPIVLDLGIVVGNAAFIGRIVETIRDVHQQCGGGSNHLIAMRDSRRDQ